MSLIARCYGLMFTGRPCRRHLRLVFPEGIPEVHHNATFFTSVGLVSSSRPSPLLFESPWVSFLLLSVCSGR
jgi:hypothetical protein